MIVFIARRLFVCSRLVVVQIQTYHQTNARVFLGELDFFLSLRKKRQNKNRFFTRSWFYFKLFRRQKRRSFGEKKQQQKSIIALRLHTTERDSSQISPLLTLSSNTRSSQDLFFLANTTRSITKKRRTRKEFVVAKEIASLALR